MLKTGMVVLAAAMGVTVVFGAIEQKPNILFFVFDDLRPLVGAYGEPEPITPNLDALAAAGVRFERNYVAYPLCKPSRATMLNGIRFDNAPVNGKWPNHTQLINVQQTWPRVLREAGYWTATRGKIYHGNVPGGEQSAWDIPGGRKSDWNKQILSRIVDQGGRPDQLEGYLKEGNGAGALVYVSVDGPDNLLNDGQVCDDVISYIKEQRDPDKPFAIACGFSRPHMPWVAPKKYFDLYPEDAGKLAYLPEGAEKTVDEEEITPKNKNDVWNEGVDDATAQKLIRGYMACTSYVDAQMGRVIQALKEEGLYDNTIIVAWGDHGYHLTDHGLWRKNTAYHISMRSPLIIKAPGVVGGRVAHQVVGNVDFYPTLLELTGVEKPEEVEFHGKSLVPLLNASNADWDNITYTCAKERYGLITEQYRFTVSENGPSLYDLGNDPHEWNNLGGHPEYAGLVEEFKAKLAKVAWNSPTGGPLKSAAPAPAAAQPQKKKKPATEWDWFSTLDANKDGSVTEEEWLKRSQAKAKKKNKSYDEAKQKKVFAGHDGNGDGVISREELK
jgi:uncharacterized sulfatase